MSFVSSCPQSKRHLITGSICGVKLTEIKNLMQDIRYLIS
ncbi:MAG: DUF2200 family protein [Streptococcus sp.]